MSKTQHTAGLPCNEAQASLRESAGSTVLLECDWRGYRRSLIACTPGVLGFLAATYMHDGKGLAIAAGIVVGLWLGCAHNLAWALAQRSRNRSNNQAVGSRDSEPAPNDKTP